jgi:hypothetical protein
MSTISARGGLRELRATARSRMWMLGGMAFVVGLLCLLWLAFG